MTAGDGGSERAAQHGTETPRKTFDNGMRDGARTPDGLVAGCYVHGLFDRGDAGRARHLRMPARALEQDVAACRAVDGIAGTSSYKVDIDAPPDPARAAA
jgi:adenosylcobyric acid synthase